VLKENEVILDPSRVAAQIVSGIGFIGAGLIFVRSDSVRGLTTAAGIWLTAAVGAAAAAPRDRHHGRLLRDRLHPRAARQAPAREPVRPVGRQGRIRRRPRHPAESARGVHVA
jgi:hypothetical protein